MTLPRRGPQPKRAEDRYVRLTVTLRPQLKEYIQELAQRQNKYTSEVVADLIKKNMMEDREFLKNKI